MQISNSFAGRDTVGRNWPKSCEAVMDANLQATQWLVAGTAAYCDKHDSDFGYMKHASMLDESLHGVSTALVSGQAPFIESR